jgi:hypothetical protein
LIDEATDNDAALSPAQRERATAETTANILQAERHESALVWKALDQSLAVSHRSNVDLARRARAGNRSRVVASAGRTVVVDGV